MLLLLRRPLRDAVRSEHSRRFGNQIQSKRDAGNNDQTAKDRSSYKRNLTRGIKKLLILVLHICAEIHKMIFLIPRDYCSCTKGFLIT